MADFSIKAFFGGDTSGLKAALGDANMQVNKFQRMVKQAGVSIGRGLGLGAVIFQVIRFGKEAVDAAQKTRDEFDKIGQPVDKVTRQLAEVGDAFQNINKVGAKTVGYLIGGWTQLFDVIASGVNRIRGISEAQENAAVKAAQAAASAEKSLAKARLDNSPEKIAAAELQLAKARRDYAYAAADGEGKINILLKENLEIRARVAAFGEQSIKGAQARIDLEKNLTDLMTVGADVAQKDADAKKKSADELAKKADELTKKAKERYDVETKLTEQRIEALHGEEKIAVEIQVINQLKKEQSAFLKDSTDWLEKQVDINDANAKLESMRVDLANEQAAAEARITDEKKKQSEREAVIAKAKKGGLSDAEIEQVLSGKMPTRGGSQFATSSIFNDVSDATLAEIIRREKEAVAKPIQRGNLTEGISRAQHQMRLDAAISQQDFRAKFRADLAAGGTEGALQAFKGDPMLFDRVLQTLTQGPDKQDKIIDTLQKTNNLLAGKFRNQ